MPAQGHGPSVLPTVMEIPEYTLDHAISPSPFTPGGYKGAGETGTVGPPPCLANAVEDAIGIRVRSMPVTAERVFAALEARRAEAPA